MKLIELKEMQQIELNLFKEFVKVCNKHHLRYYMDGGTLLGSCWFKGFIPWDDDIDLKMPRPDYEKFLTLGTELPEYISIDTPCEDKCEYVFSKIVDNRTVLIEEHNRIEKHTGVYVDLFPMDGYPDDEQECQKHLKTMGILNTLFHQSLNEFQTMRSSKSIKSRLKGTYYYKRLKSGHPVSWEICQRLTNEAKKYNFDECAYVGMTVEGNPVKERFDRKWLDETVQLPFEDDYFTAPSGYDEHLTIFYGDYMHLPKILPDHYHKVYWKEGYGEQDE